MFWIILLVVFLLLIVFVLCTPFILTLDTDHREYRLTWWGLAQASLVPDDKEIVLVRLRILFLSWVLHPLRSAARAKESGRHESVSTKNSRRRSLRHLPRRMWRVMRSFRVQKCVVDIDTGNASLNGWLYPVCWLLSNRKRSLAINFSDRNRADVRVRNSLLRILFAFIR